MGWKSFTEEEILELKSNCDLSIQKQDTLLIYDWYRNE